jgi:hypothetical protein
VYVDIDIVPFFVFKYLWKTAPSFFLLQTEKAKFGLLKTETEVCSPWSANDKR